MVFQIIHFTIRKLFGFSLLPRLSEPDFFLAVLIYIINFVGSLFFFFLIASSDCDVTEVRIQGLLRFLGLSGIPILIYGIVYEEELPYNVIIAQPVDVEFNYQRDIEIPVYTNNESNEYEESNIEI
jgi:hypothetical protein